MEELLKEGANFLLSLTAVIIATIKGKGKTKEEKKEAKKQKLIKKLEKLENKKPIEETKNQEQTIANLVENSEFVKEIIKPNWQQAFGVKTEKETETQGE